MLTPRRELIGLGSVDTGINTEPVDCHFIRTPTSAASTSINNQIIQDGRDDDGRH